MPDAAQLVAQALAQRRLSTKDKRFYGSLDSELGSVPPESLAADLSPENLRQLGLALEQAKTPQQRAMLLNEVTRLKQLAQTLAGPVQPPELPPGALDNGYQKPTYTGGARAERLRNPTVQHQFGGDQAEVPYRTDIPPFFRNHRYPDQPGLIPGVEGRVLPVWPPQAPEVIPPAMSGVRG